MIQVYFLRLFRKTVGSKHCKRVGKHVCTYRFACQWLSPAEAGSLSEAMRSGNVPRRKLPKRES
jgi:hypothetical protein